MYPTNTLTLSLLMATAATAAALTIDSNNPYFADGVQDTTPDSSSISSVDKELSTRFYDSNKGAEWVGYYSDGSTPMDSLMCWAHAAANSIEYWQSYYGVFYTGTRELPYGKVGTEPAYYYATTTVANCKQLNVAKAFYDNWENQAGTFSSAADWYFKWDSESANGGYYSNYFGNADSTRSSYITVYSQRALGISDEENVSAGHSDSAFADTAAGLKGALTPAFGLTQNSDGSYTQTQVGLLPFIGIWYDVEQADGSSLSYGHMLNCYGFTTDANGDIKTLLLTNPDDNISQIENVTVKEENGQLMLYDPDGSHFLNKNWYIGEVSYINTPEILLSMYAGYSDSDTALVWNGESSIWQTPDSPTNTLPDASAGWNVTMDTGEENTEAYHSHTTEGRKVRFDSHGGGGTITINGTVAPGEIEIAETDYYFAAGEEAAIAGSGDIIIRQGATLNSEVDLGTRSITVEERAEFGYVRGEDTQVGSISAGENTAVRFRNSSGSTDITYTADTLQGIRGKLCLGAAEDAYATHLTTKGDIQVQDLVLTGAATISTDGVVSICGSLQSLSKLQAASTFSLRTAVQGAAIDADLDLTQTTSYTAEAAVSLNGHTLMLSATRAITLTLPYELERGESFTLFEGISELSIDGKTYTESATWAAADFFVGDYVSDNMALVYTQSAPNVGTLSLVYPVPEPGSAALSLLGLVGIVSRRRRK